MGYPASHACMRLKEKDARYLNDWADQWILRGKDKVLIKGTPVIVFGSYNFMRQNFGCSYLKNQWTSNKWA